MATLTPEQIQIIATGLDQPVRLVDPQSNQTYVLVRAEDYDRIKPLLNDDFCLTDTYAAQLRSALKAGWDDPAMDDYNNYDESYRKLCESDEATLS